MDAQEGWPPISSHTQAEDGGDTELSADRFLTNACAQLMPLIAGSAEEYTFSFLFEFLCSGAHGCRSAVLRIILNLMGNCDLQHTTFQKHGRRWFAAMLNYLNGGYCDLALQVLEVVVERLPLSIKHAETSTLHPFPPSPTPLGYFSNSEKSPGSIMASTAVTAILRSDPMGESYLGVGASSQFFREMFNIQSEGQPEGLAYATMMDVTETDEWDDFGLEDEDSAEFDAMDDLGREQDGKKRKERTKQKGKDRIAEGKDNETDRDDKSKREKGKKERVKKEERKEKDKEKKPTVGPIEGMRNQQSLPSGKRVPTLPPSKSEMHGVPIQGLQKSQAIASPASFNVGAPSSRFEGFSEVNKMISDLASAKQESKIMESELSDSYDPPSDMNAAFLDGSHNKTVGELAIAEDVKLSLVEWQNYSFGDAGGADVVMVFPLAADLLQEILADYQDTHEAMCDEVAEQDVLSIIESSVMYADMLDHSLFHPPISSLSDPRFFSVKAKYSDRLAKFPAYEKKFLEKKNELEGAFNGHLANYVDQREIVAKYLAGMDNDDDSIVDEEEAPTLDAVEAATALVSLHMTLLKLYEVGVHINALVDDIQETADNVEKILSILADDISLNEKVAAQVACLQAVES